MNLKDAEEGKTLFIINLPVTVTETKLKNEFSKLGNVRSIKLVKDPETKVFKGSAFVQFESKNSVEKIINKQSKTPFVPYKVCGSDVQVALALTRKKLVNSKKKKDTKNLYLAKEGVISANENLPEKVIESQKRSLLEKCEKLKNPNFSLSKKRLSVHNIPANVTEKELKALFKQAAEECRKEATRIRKRPVQIKQVKIARDKARRMADGSFRSKRFGFVEFAEHRDSLNVLRKLNGTERMKDDGMRIEFAIEDARKLHKQKLRLERSSKKNNFNRRKNEKDFKKTKRERKDIKMKKRTLFIMEKDQRKKEKRKNK